MNFQIHQTVPESKAKSLLNSAEVQGVEAIRFTKVKEYTTFDVEYAYVDNDIVFHFFLPDDVNHLQGAQEYWKTRFPEVLDIVSQEYWDATYPRLQAAFTEELDSWWMRCFGFAHVGNPESRIKKFLDKLDNQIDKGRG